MCRKRLAGRVIYKLLGVSMIRADEHLTVYFLNCRNSLSDALIYRFDSLDRSALAQEFTKLGYTYTMPFYFPSIGEYAAMLEKTGFTVRCAVLFDRPTRLNGEDGLTDWIKMFVKNPFVNVTEDDRQVILKKAVSALAPALYKDGVWYSDYVRLRMKAVKENTGNSIQV